MTDEAHKALDNVTEAELAVAKKRIEQMVAEGIPRERAASAALVEIGHTYYLRALLRGLKSMADGKRGGSRALGAFERALRDAGRLADPMRKWLAQMGIDSLEEAEGMIRAVQHARLADEHDRDEAAAQLLEERMKTDPDARDRYLRRFGFHTEVTDDGEHTDTAQALDEAEGSEAGRDPARSEGTVPDPRRARSRRNAAEERPAGLSRDARPDRQGGRGEQGGRVPLLREQARPVRARDESENGRS